MLIRVLEGSSDNRVALSSLDDRVAMEKGRLMAARALAADPGRRRELEDQWGVDIMMERYPEVYWSGFGNKLDRVAPMFPE